MVTGLIFYFVPNTNKVRFRDVWPGAIIAGLLWRGALAGFKWYVRDLSRFSVHGTIASVVVFLLWVYVSAVVLLYGVEITVAYAQIRPLLARQQQGRVDGMCPTQAPAAPSSRPYLKITHSAITPSIRAIDKGGASASTCVRPRW